MSNASDIKGTVVPAEVSDLISESQTIQGWMDRLAGHQNEADPAVFDRVRTDYQGRLDKVTAKLVQHRSKLVASLESRQKEVDSLQADRDTQAGHLEEARLRHAVGEFSDSQWDEARGNIEGSLSEVDELLGMEAGAVSELAAIIDSIGEGGTPSASSTGPDSGAEEEFVAAVQSQAAPDATADQDGDEDGHEAVGDGDHEEAEAVADDARESDADESAEAGEEEDDVEITVEAEDDDPTAAVTETENETAEATAEVSDGEGGEYLDELEFLESLSLDEPDRFDAVSAMLDEDEGKDDA